MRLLRCCCAVAWLGLLLLGPGAQARMLKEVNLRGAGASFPGEVYKSWMPMYKSDRIKFASVFMTYEAVGSGSGKARIKEEKIPPEVTPIEYAGADSLLKDEDYVNHPDLQMFPSMAGAVVLGFNIPGTTSLNLTRDHVVGIYNGTYPRWDDASIQAINPAVIMPSHFIIPIVRADKSGTTEIFTTALCTFSPEWTSAYGHFSSGMTGDIHEKWNSSVVNKFGYKQNGVSGLILSTRYSISYLSVSGAVAAKISVANIKNRAGHFITASTESVQKAMDDFAASMSARLTSSIVDGHSSNTYPIAAYTYFIVKMTTMINCDSAVELVRYITWFMYDTNARKECALKQMTPLSKAVADKVLANVLRRMKCEGLALYPQYEAILQEETTALQTWRVPVFVAGPLVGLCLLLIVIMIGYQKFKLNQGIWKNEWKIEMNSLRPVTDEKAGASKMSTNSAMEYQQTMETFKFDGEVVFITPSSLGENALKFDSKKMVLWLRDNIVCNNIQRFSGVLLKDDQYHYVLEFCKKGTLPDILQNDKYDLDINFQLSMCIDIAEGIDFLHGMNIVHGNLRSEDCYLDKRWNVKIGGWPDHTLCWIQNREGIEEREDPDDDPNVASRRLYYTAPEILRRMTPGPSTRDADIYSFAIIMQEILTRDDAYAELAEEFEPENVILYVKNKGLRPQVLANISVKVKMVLEMAWAENPIDRLNSKKLIKALRASRSTNKSVLDCMMDVVEEYAVNLEEKIEERTREVKAALSFVEELLYKILPASVADKLSRGESIDAETFDACTIFFSDIVGFTSISSGCTPFDVVNLLNDLYTCFDSVIDRYDAYKVETIGDAYMVASGVPVKNGNKHASEIATMALAFGVGVSNFVIRHKPDQKMRLRAGIHTGPVAAGVVGAKMPRYCLFGGTVHIASKMESSSAPMKIQISEPTCLLLERAGGFHMKLRGKQVPFTGSEEICTYWLNGKENFDLPEEFARDVLE